MIKKNNQTIDKIYKGTTEIAKIYKGSTLVYENYRDIVATGNDIINITKAKAGSLNYLKAFGKCEQRRLPVGYTELEYIQSNASAYINTHFNCTSDSGLKIKYRYIANGSAAISGIYTPGTPRTDALFVSSGSGTTSGTNEFIFATTNGSAISGSNNYSLSLNTDYVTEVNYLNSGKTYINDTFNRQCGTETPNNGDILLFARKNANNDNITASNSRIYYAIFTENQTVSKYFIPAKRNSDGVLGMYDTINDTFYTNAGTGTFTAGAEVTGPTPSNPIPIWCNNGELKFGKPITIDSTRIFAFINPDGYWVSSADSYSVAIPVVTGKKYIISFTNTDSDTVGTIFRYGFSATNIPTGQTLTQWVRTTPQGTSRVELTADKSYLIIQMGYNVAEGNISSGYITLKEATIYADGTVETIEIDTTGDTATCQNLLSAGTYKDVQSILDGAVTRNVGIKVLTGSENWAASSTANLYSLDGLNNYDSANFQNGVVFCTHFIGVLPTTSGADMPNYSLRTGGASGSSDVVRRTIYIKYAGFSSVNDFKQWLADQYANGTPVIIVYPLATPTTETATAQPLNLQKGTNIIEVTEASLDGLGLEVKYKGK